MRMACAGPAIEVTEKTDIAPEQLLLAGLEITDLLGFVCRPKDLPGKPYIVYRRERLVVFVRRQPHIPTGKSAEYWQDKYDQALERHARNEQVLADTGWTVINIWEYEINEDLLTCVEKVQSVLRRDNG